MPCTCVKQPAGTGRGKVQGFITTTPCQECLDQRAIDAVNQAEQKKYEDIHMVIAQEAQIIAKDKLIKDGKLEEKNGKITIK